MTKNKHRSAQGSKIQELARWLRKNLRELEDPELHVIMFMPAIDKFIAAQREHLRLVDEARAARDADESTPETEHGR